jgi:cyclophilin family peptidyl-prolyl cis-trans isomerase
LDSRWRYENGTNFLLFQQNISYCILCFVYQDIASGKGNTSESVYGGFFEDESFSVLNDKRGVVGMANNGRHSNGSQFYFTLQPAAWMNKKYVAFG